MRRFYGAANLWLIVLMLPILLVAMLALLDYLRYQQQRSRLEQVARYAVEWSVFSGQGDLYDVYGIRSVIPERVRDVLNNELHSQLSKDESELGFKTELKLVQSQNSLLEPQTIKHVILQRQYFGFAMDGAHKLIDALDLVDQLKSSIAALAKTLKIIEQIDRVTMEARSLAVEYARASDRIPAQAPQRLAILATSISQAQVQAFNLRDALDETENILSSNQASEAQRKLAIQLRTKHHQSLAKLQEDLQEWRLTLVEYREASNALKEVLVSTRNLVTALDQIAKEIQASDLIKPLEEGTLKETLKPIASLWDSSGKVIALIKNSIEVLVPKATKWIECFEKDVDALLAVSEPFFKPTGGLVDQPFALLTQEQLPVWPEMNIGEAVLALIDDKSPLKNPESFKAWLKSQTLKIMTTVSSLYGKDIPADTFRHLPSQVKNLVGIPPEEANNVKSTGGFKGVIEATSFWQSFKSHLDGFGAEILERAIVHDYVLDYFSYNVPRDFGQNRSLGEVEYLLIGSRYGLVNATATDAQIGLLRIGLNAVALLITKQQTLQTISTQLAAVTGGISYPVAYGIVLGGWAIAESASDLLVLHRGDEVALCKFDGDFSIDLANVVRNFIPPENIGPSKNNDNSSDEGKGLSEGSKAERTDDSKGQKAALGAVLEQLTIKWSYEDYLGLLLFTIPEDRLLLRIADLWQLASAFDLSRHFSQLHFEASQSFHGIVFRGGTIHCPIDYHVLKGIVAD